MTRVQKGDIVVIKSRRSSGVKLAKVRTVGFGYAQLDNGSSIVSADVLEPADGIYEIITGKGRWWK